MVIKIARLSMIFLVFFAMSSINAQEGSFDPARYGLPSRIAGYVVLAVHTSENTACMRNGVRRVVLQTSEPDVDSLLRNVQLSPVLEELSRIASINWQISFVGAGVNLENIQSNIQKWNNYPCRTLSPINSGSDGDEIGVATGNPGRALFENIDAGAYTDDNAQGVYLVAPTVGNNQNQYSAFLSNVLTDSSTFYFLQNGFIFQGGGSVVWSDTTQGYVAQAYSSQPYGSGQIYQSTITYTSSNWWMCLNSIYGYECIYESGASGTTLAADLNTSVWVENFNTNVDWYQGFSNPWRATSARIFRNGNGNWWGSEHRHTVHACGVGNYPTADAITGDLLSGNSGYFNLDYVPLHC